MLVDDLIANLLKCIIYCEGIILASNKDPAEFTLRTQRVTIVWFWYINPLTSIAQSPQQPEGKLASVDENQECGIELDWAPDG